MSKLKLTKYDQCDETKNILPFRIQFLMQCKIVCGVKLQVVSEKKHNQDSEFSKQNIVTVNISNKQ